MIERMKSILNKKSFLTQKQKPFDYKCYLKAKTRLNNKITRKRKKIRKIFFISILISRQKIEIPIFIFHSSCNLIQTHTHTHVLNCFSFAFFFCRSSRRRPPSPPPSSASWPSSRPSCSSGARCACARVCRIRCRPLIRLRPCRFRPLIRLRPCRFRPLIRFRPWRSLLSRRPLLPLLVEAAKGVSLRRRRQLVAPDTNCRTAT